MLYYDCTNYFFEIERKMVTGNMEEAGSIAQTRSLQMGMFMDGMVSLSLFSFSGNANEQTSLKPLEEKILQVLDVQELFIQRCWSWFRKRSKKLNHADERAFIVTQSFEKLNKDDKAWALDKTG